MTRNSWRSALAAGALTPLLLLAGCGSDDVAEKVAEEALEEAAGGSADVDVDDDGLTVTDDEGNTSTIGTDLPDDFPVDDVPLLEGEVLSATAVEGKSFMVMIQVDGAAEAAQDDAVALLTDAGYDGESESMAEGFYTAQLTKPGFEVGVNTVEAEGAAQVQYVVTVS